MFHFPATSLFSDRELFQAKTKELFELKCSLNQSGSAIPQELRTADQKSGIVKMSCIEIFVASDPEKFVFFIARKIILWKPDVCTTPSHSMLCPISFMTPLIGGKFSYRPIFKILGKSLKIANNE